MIAKKKDKEETKRESNAEGRKSTKHVKQKLDSGFVARGIGFKNALANPKILGPKTLLFLLL